MPDSYSFQTTYSLPHSTEFKLVITGWRKRLTGPRGKFLGWSTDCRLAVDLRSTAPINSEFEDPKEISLMNVLYRDTVLPQLASVVTTFGFGDHASHSRGYGDEVQMIVDATKASLAKLL